MSESKLKKLYEEKPSQIELPNDVQQAIKRLPPKFQSTLVGFISNQISVRSESFPGPHPDTLRAYEEIVPGSAAELFELTKSQTKHRQKLENDILPKQVNLASRGQIFAFILAILFLGGTIYLAINDHDVVAGVLGGSTIVSILSAFITGKVTAAKQNK